MSLPNFLIIGPPRTGTTWLFRVLNRHPQIFIPDVKQVHFFDKHYDQGSTWYRAFYQNKTQKHIALGELTPDYFSHPQAAARIHEVLGPTIKLFIVYRDPVERAISEYKTKFRIGRIQGTFLEALQNENIIIENSLYAKNLQRYMDYFPLTSLHILHYQNLVDTPMQYVQEIYRALNIDTTFTPELPDEPINKSLSSVRLHSLVKQIVKVRQQIEKYYWGRKTLWMLRDYGIIGYFHRMTSTTSTDSHRLTHDNGQIFYQYFAKDMEEFQRICTRINQLGSLIQGYY